MAKFLTELDTHLKEGSDRISVLDSSLIYESDILGRLFGITEGYSGFKVEMSGGFETDFASVPRFPIVYWFWGGREHREAVLHDYLFCKDSIPVVSFSVANAVFLEAAECHGKSAVIRYPMFWGVWLGGYPSYHKRSVMDKL